jgi:hypothetical protein
MRRPSSLSASSGNPATPSLFARATKHAWKERAGGSPVSRVDQQIAGLLTVTTQP